MSEYLTFEEIIEIHKELIEQFGGTIELKDPGMLEAALFRPQSGYYNGLIEEATALMESLGMNHPFIDGNKRVAFFATDTFLRMNGYFIDCDDFEAHDHIVKLLSNHEFNFDNLHIWLQKQVKPLIN
jgi:death-on-curing protein